MLKKMIKYLWHHMTKTVSTRFHVLHTLQGVKKVGFEGEFYSLRRSVYRKGIAWKELDEDTLMVLYGSEWDEQGRYTLFHVILLSRTILDRLRPYVEQARDLAPYEGDWEDMSFPWKIATMYHYFGPTPIFGEPGYGFRIKNPNTRRNPACK